MGVIKHSRTYSSDGIQTTPSANYEVKFQYNANSFTLKAVGNALNIKFNDETNYHYLDANESIIIEDMLIGKFQIKESGVKYVYHALVM